MITNVGNVRVEVDEQAVRVSMNTPHPTKLDCLLTFKEAQSLARLLMNVKAGVEGDEFDDLLG